VAAALWLTACVTIALQPVEALGDKEAACINTPLGAEYLGMGHLELARTKLARALCQSSELAAAHWTNARLHMHLGRPGFAEQHFRTMLELDPQGARAHSNFGVVLCAMGRLEGTQVQVRVSAL
jgi:Tfp pilus assembly protein PilF